MRTISLALIVLLMTQVIFATQLVVALSEEVDKKPIVIGGTYRDEPFVIGGTYRDEPFVIGGTYRREPVVLGRRSVTPTWPEKIPSKESDKNPKDQGNTVPKDQGNTVPKDQGNTVPKDRGNTVPKDQGNTVPKDQGNTVPKDLDNAAIFAIVLSIINTLMNIPSLVVSWPQFRGQLAKFTNYSGSNSDPVYVKGYYRKDGTYVRSHYRKGSGSRSSSTEEIVEIVE